MPAPKTTRAAVDAFIASRVGASPKYISWLEYTLGKLLLLGPRNLPVRAEPLEAALHAITAGDETLRDVYIAWRRMYRWLGTRYDLPNPMLEITRPPVRTKTLPAFTQAEVAQLIYRHATNPQALALLLLLLDTGARIGEAYNLRWHDIKPTSLKLDGKTGEREVPISTQTSRALLATATTEVMWRNRLGRPFTLDGLKQHVTMLLSQAGLRGAPHKLRHTFGRLYIENGGDVFSLQRIMGHANIKTTERYLRGDMTSTRKQHSQFSPVAQLSPAHQQPLRLVANE